MNKRQKLELAFRQHTKEVLGENAVKEFAGSELEALCVTFIQKQGQALPLVDVSACLPNLPDLQHKHDLNNATGWTSHPDDCYLEGVEETYKAIKKELSNKY